MRCLILQDEISEEECAIVTKESYLEKNTKELPKKCKRIVGWKLICKQCQNHCQNNKK